MAKTPNDGALAIDPMHQFDVVPLIPIHIGGIDLSFTNSSLWMVIAVLTIAAMTVFVPRARVPGRWQAAIEALYEFTRTMVEQNAGKNALPYFPFVFCLFMFVLLCNLLGMVPYSFTVTSHIAVTFALAISIFVGVTVLGFAKNGFGFLRLFAPRGVPWILLPPLVVIELISYFTRPISLSVRLFANMMAGHTMLKVFGGFVVALGFIGGWAPLAFMVAITGLEVLVAVMQAYVFAILTCIYLNDALNMAH